MCLKSLLPCCLFFIVLRAQADSTLVIGFDFNDHRIREVQDRSAVRAYGATLTKDRFGNEESAVYLHGHSTSYVNLGTSDLLKPEKGSISLWVNMQHIVLAGKGYSANPFLSIRNAPGEDFNLALGIGYSIKAKRAGVQATNDSLQEVIIFTKDTMQLNRWYHLLVTYDNDHMAFYTDGKSQGRQIKGFRSFFFKNDSVMLGKTAGTKNQRFTHAIFDDIRIFHRVLTPEEVLALYHEPNPNRNAVILQELLKYGTVAVILGMIIVLLILRNKRNLKRQREYYELKHKVKELEIKVIKTQINPHFTSNCLAAIHNLILTGEVDKAGDYLAKFSFFLRQVLDHSDRTYLTLEEELGIIRLNVDLEQLRFKSEFKFVLEAEADILLNEVMIPSLISQPFIENAIWHGLLPLEERSPLLRVRVYRTGSTICLSIEDNGVGRSSKKSRSNSKGTLLAQDKIDSINQLRNSVDYTLHILDLKDELGRPAGTHVIIKLNPNTDKE